LTAELVEYQPVLEIGVGTGRMAVPVAERGLDVIGVDLSEAMLVKLREKTSAGEPLPVTIADATTLPFHDRAFGSAVACHVLHLIPSWQAAVHELLRVVRGGGRILIDAGGFTDVVNELQEHLAAEAGLAGRHPGMNGTDELDRLLQSTGVHMRLAPPISDIRSVTVNGVITAFELNLFSWTWPLDDGIRHAAAATTREWAKDAIGALDNVREIDVPIRWRIYDLPPGG
jgi:SAM-dependent methyltransferase